MILIQKVDPLVKWSFLLLGFALPLSTSVTLMAGYLTMAGLILLGGWQKKWLSLANNRVAWAILLLLLLMLFGTFYNILPFADTIKYLWKYNYWLLALLLMTYCRNRQMVTLGLYAFLGGMVVILLLAWLMRIFYDAFLLFSDAYPVLHAIEKLFILKYIPIGIMLVFYTFILAHLSLHFKQHRWIFILLALFGIHHIVYYSPGRTGHVLLLLLIFLFLLQSLGRKYIIYIFFIMIVLLTAFVTTSTMIQQRLDQAVTEYTLMKPANRESSIGQRLEFAINGWSLVQERPLLGSGIGSVATRYAGLCPDKVTQAYDEQTLAVIYGTANLHNQYLEFMVQFGVLGLMVLGYLFYSQWQACQTKEPMFKHLAQGFVLLFVVGCLINSMLMDLTERYFFTYFTGLFFAHIQEPDST